MPVAASIATIERLLANHGEVYRHVEALGARMESGLNEMIARHGVTASVARQGSAFSIYFMDQFFPSAECLRAFLMSLLSMRLRPWSQWATRTSQWFNK